MRRPNFVAASLATIGLVLATPAVVEAKRPAKPVAAGTTAVAPKQAAKQEWAASAPRLIVAISVDQFSADEFSQFRRYYSAGLARLQQGAVFPQGYQSHAATETCPGHSTLMTGDHPARTGIIANNWYGARPGAAVAKIYCAEDETNPASSPAKPVVSAGHLKVPTLGERMKAADPKSLNVAVSGKDRAAVMMGGHVIDAAYWWDGTHFTTFANRTNSPSADAENTSVDKLLKVGAPAYDVPEFCKPRDVALPLRTNLTVGTYKFPLALDPAAPDQEKTDFRVSPRLDEATADLALKLVDELKLGADASPDVLSVSLSANDYIGHAYGTQGVEMCIQQAALDRTVGKLLDGLDARGIDYVVMLTADHGMIDLPERNNLFAYPSALRASADTSPATLSQRIASELGLTRDANDPLVPGEGSGGDYYLAKDLTPDQRDKVTKRLVELLQENPLIETVFTADQIAAVPVPSGSPQDWTLIQRARASFLPGRSGDVFAVLKRGINGVTDPKPGIVATHGSPWDYDRRVPILFWRKGMTSFEQPDPVETVDIAPTFAALVGLKVEDGAFDGRCLNLAGPTGDICAAQ